MPHSFPLAHFLGPKPQFMSSELLDFWHDVADLSEVLPVRLCFSGACGALNCCSVFNTPIVFYAVLQILGPVANLMACEREDVAYALSSLLGNKLLCYVTIKEDDCTALYTYLKEHYGVCKVCVCVCVCVCVGEGERGGFAVGVGVGGYVEVEDPATQRLFKEERCSAKRLLDPVSPWINVMLSQWTALTRSSPCSHSPPPNSWLYVGAQPGGC
eukprot:1161904-Pelagomonas_calceolata.AAC.12